MKRLVRLLVIAALSLVGALALAAGLGLLLPRRHTAVTRVLLKRPPAEVWAAISDLPSQTAWRSDLEGAERMPDHEGREVWLQHTDHGDWTLEFTTREEPRLLVTTVADSSQGFGGSWTYEIGTVDTGTVLTITESGFIDSPLFRFLARFVFGLHGSQEAYLRDLVDHLGESGTPRRVL
jgi:uncharacterized protein YndB with AHSA1/START domain